MKYNKLKRIVRAKHGSRIPKFQNPHEGLWQIPSSQQQLYNQAFNWALPNLSNPNPFMDGGNSPINTQQLFTNTASTNYSNFLKNNKPSFLNKLGNKAGQLFDKTGQFLETPTGQSIVGMGLDYLGGQFNNVENSSGVDNAFAAVDTVGNIVGTVNPMAGLAVKAGSTLLKGINSTGGKRADQFSINQNTIENVGGSYGGSVDDINNAAQKAGKKYGLFSGGKRHKANRQIREARRQQNIMTDIANEASDQRAMISDLNYIRHAFDINGGYDLSNIRVAKSGMKIQDKINLVKSKKFNNSYINIDTKTIEKFKQGGSIQSEWEPIIEDVWEPTIEEFKEGGTLQPEWEPVIELQEGGSVKKSFKEWFNSIPKDNRASGYDYKKAYEVLDWETLYNHTKDPEKYHLYSVSPIADEGGNYPFLKLGKIEDNPEIQGEFDWYNSEEGKEHRSKFDIKYIKDRYYYVPKKFKNGGKTQEEISEIEETNQKNVIPEGALHKNKHHMEHTEGLTQKGIPVVDNDGNQQAEIELNEIIFNLEVTKFMEERYHKYFNDDMTQKEKDQLAIEVGELLVDQILNNTDDRTNLIAKCREGGKL